MATQDIHIETKRSGLAGIGRALTTLWRILGGVESALARAHEIERLNALSDTELAKRGLRRNEIAHYVFRDKIYI